MSSSASPIKVEYQPHSNSVLIYQSGKGGIQVVDVPVDELRAVIPKVGSKTGLFDRFRRS